MNMESVFTGCAIAGGALFLFRLAVQLLGFSGDVSGDIPGDGHDLLHSTEPDSSFRALSLLGITAFLMMFGLAGRAMMESRPGAAPAAVGVGLLAGGASLWLMAWLFKGMRKMQSGGTANYEKAVGQEGTVYLTIPENDVGKVQIAFQGRLNVVDARSANGKTLATGARVRVARIVDGNILEVVSA